MIKKLGRNQSCPCGSGLKYKRCHGRFGSDTVGGTPFVRPEMTHVLQQHDAAERIRERQQGLGRPIIAFKAGDHQIVAVRNTLYFSDNWKTFPDFLADYLKWKLDPAWGNAELAKPFAERHPLIQLYDAYTRYQHETIKTPGEVHSATITGIVACYLGLAYSLYLLDHNVELQDRLIRRLKDPANFQGAYYELMVASILIRAGFALTLEDETDEASKHCEFAAVSKITGKKYWVEAKMRSIAGMLGKTEKDGGADGNSTARLIPHLNDALAKPTTDERLIFIDLNANPEVKDPQKPEWLDRVTSRLERYEAKELPAGVSAYVFVTNMSFHRQLSDPPAMVAVPFGLGIPDFNKPGTMRVSEAYRRKQKHIDAHNIGEAFTQYTNFPTTFDGNLPSEALGGASTRPIIGETYHFADIGEHGLVATVRSATVNEREKQVYIGVTDAEGTSHILRQPMSDEQIAEYKAHSDAYFGKVTRPRKGIEDLYGLFEWFMDVNKGLSRATLLERLAKAPNFEVLKDMSDADLLGEYCEAMVAAYERSGLKLDTTQEASQNP